LIKWWRKMEIYWSVRGAKWRFGNVREENEKGKRGRAAEIGRRPFSTGSSDEPVLKVQLWPHLCLKFGLKPFCTGS
jgi:hypothetical protein